MQIERSVTGSVTVLAVIGEFDGSDPASIDALIPEGCTSIVFNMRRVDHIDSSGLAYLLKAAKRLASLDGEPVFSEPSKPFQRMIESFGLDQTFRIFPNDDEALDYFRVASDEGGDFAILSSPVEFDAFNVPEVGDKVDKLIQKGHTHLIFNMRRLRFINSSALAYLIKTARRLKELGGELVISEPSKFFRTTIKTLGLDQFFRTFPTNDEAVEHSRKVGRVATDVELLSVFFRLLDAPDTLAVGGMLLLYEDGPTFKYPVGPDDVTIEPEQLLIGRELRIQFPLPLDEGVRLVEMEAEVVMAVELDEGARKYRLRYTTIDDADRRLLEQYVRGDRDDGATGVSARLPPRRPSGSGEAPPQEEGTA